MAADEKWYFTKEQLMNTPSRRNGIDNDKELSYRQQAANLIQDMGQRLSVSQLCINTAIVYMHRFYMFHSLTAFHRNSMASASLFLAAKVEEQPRKLEHVIKVAHMCLHRNEQQAPDTKSDLYLEQAQDLVFNENILLQTLGFDVAIDHPHTHVVRCCQLVKASKDLAQTSYFMASNSLHLTTMCLQYKPTVVACFCIHLACKWSNWEIPQSNEGRHWFWYVDRSVTSELLQQLTAEFLHIFDKCPSRLKRKIMSISANQSPNMSHPALSNSPFDAEPRRVQSPAAGSDGGMLIFSSNRSHHEKLDDKKATSSAMITAYMGRPPMDNREYREKKDRERLEREKAAPMAPFQGHSSDLNKHHSSHHHKQISSVGMPNKHLSTSSSQKGPLHHNHHHHHLKVNQTIPQRLHSNNSQSRDLNRDPNRQRPSREYNSSSTSGGTMYTSSHGHLDNSHVDPSINNRSLDSSLLQQESVGHSNQVEKLGNNNHGIHRLSTADCNKHQPHDKRSHDFRHKQQQQQQQQQSLEHRKDLDVKSYHKYPESLKLDRQRKPDSLEQRSEEVRKLIEKPLPPLKPRPEVQKEEYIAHMLKTSHNPKYNQSEKLQCVISQNAFVHDKSPNSNLLSSSSTQGLQKPPLSKTSVNQHSAHGVSQILKDTIKNGNSQMSLSSSSADEQKVERRLRHDETDKGSSNSQQGLLQTPPGRQRSLFSPEKVPSSRDSQRLKYKQKTPPVAAKVPKHERASDSMLNLELVIPFKDSSGNQQKTNNDSMSYGSDIGRVIDSKPTEPESLSTMQRHALTNGLDTNTLKQEFHVKEETTEFTQSRMKEESQDSAPESFAAKQESQESNVKTDILPPELEFQPKPDYLSPLKSAQSISALLQEPLAPMPSLFQQTTHQEQSTLSQQSVSSASTVSVASTKTSNISQEVSIPSTVDLRVLSIPLVPIQTTSVNSMTSAAVSVSTSGTSNAISIVPSSSSSQSEEKKSEHHKSEKKKKEKKHKHKEKEKSKDKHKHRHKDKEKEKHREKDKTKSEESLPAAPIRITIPKDKLNLSADASGLLNTSSSSIEKTVSPQGSSLKIKIPKKRLKVSVDIKNSNEVTSPLVQTSTTVQQAPLKIKIRTGVTSSSGSSSSSATEITGHESRKRERSEGHDSSVTVGPPSKKQQVVSGPSSVSQQRPNERQNGRHYSSSSNNKVRGGGRGARQFSAPRVPPPMGLYPNQQGYQGYQRAPNHEQEPSFGAQIVHPPRNPRHSHLTLPPPCPDAMYARQQMMTQPPVEASTGTSVSSSAGSSYFFTNFPPPPHGVYNPAGYMYDPALYYQQYQQQQYMYPGGNMIITPDGAIDTSVPPPTLIRPTQGNSSNAPPPLPSGPPPSSSPPPPPPPE